MKHPYLRDQVFLTPRLSTDVTLLREYLDEVFYPGVFDDSALIEDEQGEIENPNYLNEADRTLALHHEFVTFCGPRQRDWYFEFVLELIYFFNQCGAADICVKEALHEPAVVAVLFPYWE